MSKKIFSIGIPCIFASISMVVIFGIYGLNNMDKVQAEENAKAAFGEVYSDFVNSEVDITRTLKLYSSDKFCHTGSFLFSETELLDNSYAALLKDIPVDCSIVRYPEQRTTKANVVLEGDGQFHFDGYVNDESIIFKLEEFYNGYFSVPNENIKESYNESLWFNLLGDIMGAIPDEFKVDLYPDIQVRKYVISEYLKKCEEQGLLEDIVDGVSFEKTAAQRDFFVGDTYVASNEYVVTVSKAAMADIGKLIADYVGKSEEELLKPEKYEFLAYISSGNNLMGAKFNFSISYNDLPYEAEVLFSFSGKENVFDRTVADVRLLGQDNSIYSFRILLTNETLDGQQNTTLIAAMNQPYISRLCEVELTRNLVTNELTLNAAVNIPGLKGNINYAGELYTDELVAPEGAYNVYELNLWQILNIYSSANWSFIK